jgi:transcription initiation factor IIE alpha subunit
MRHTSIEALQKVAPLIPSFKKRVLDLMIERGAYGATDQEIETALEISGNTIRPTRMSLLKAGDIVDSGMTRLNHNGNKCIVWVINQPTQKELF